jgi:two-component system KDP operon response regulator KdpE
VVILDLGLPDIGGVEVVKRLREWTEVPVIILSARTDETDKIAALDAGADDYLTKPFGVGELLARLRVAMRPLCANAGWYAGRYRRSGYRRPERAPRRTGRRSRAPDTDRIPSAGAAGKARRQGAHTPAPVEGSLGTLARRGRAYLRIYMAQLRRKLEADAAQPRYLITEPGVGYRLALT